MRRTSAAPAPDLKAFVAALKKGRPASAREELAKIKVQTDLFGKGYKLALEGMCAGLGNGNQMSLIYRLMHHNGQSTDLVKRAMIEADSRRRKSYLPDDEIGFSSAWVDVLEHFIQPNNQSNNHPIEAQ